PAAVLRGVADLVRLGEQQRDRVPRRLGHRRRYCRAERTERGLPGGAEAGRALRAAGRARRRAALLDRRPARRARKPARVPGPEAAAVFAGQALRRQRRYTTDLLFVV